MGHHQSRDQVPEVTPLELANEPAVAAVEALRTAAMGVDVPDFPAPCRYVFRGELASQGASRRAEPYVAMVDGEVVGYLGLELPQLENRDHADVALVIHPDYRRRGLGREVHRFLLERLRQLGRDRYAARTVAALPGGPQRSDAGGRFAAAMGAEAALPEIRCRLDLHTMDQLSQLPPSADLSRRAVGYRLVSWQGRTPERFAADAAYLEGRLLTDAPRGALDGDPPRIDADRLHEREDMVMASRWLAYSTGAVHESSGVLVAQTTLGLQKSSRWHAYQSITLVDPAHRGHRLGLLVKLENLRQTRAAEPDLRVIDTWNAASNQHMITINEAMGFRPVDSWMNWQHRF